MSKIKSEPNPAGKPELTAQQHAQKQERARRRFHTFFGFWKLCDNKRCKRSSACAGDVERCGQRFYPQIPPETKAWIHKYIEARRGGATHEQAAKIAHDHIDHYDAVLREIEERHHAKLAAPDGSHPARVDPVEEAAATDRLSGPRVRVV